MSETKSPEEVSCPATVTVPHSLTRVGGKHLAQRGAGNPARARSAAADPSRGVAFTI